MQSALKIVIIILGVWFAFSRSLSVFTVDWTASPIPIEVFPLLALFSFGFGMLYAFRKWINFTLGFLFLIFFLTIVFEYGNDRVFYDPSLWENILMIGALGLWKANYAKPIPNTKSNLQNKKEEYIKKISNT
ncbi:hypothetical protein [Curvivirga sp.]|uniref:hypothetical protein n=1 Tax=Curvivirga sp. TaxID=2856848 RepID=UPI003B5A9422